MPLSESFFLVLIICCFSTEFTILSFLFWMLHSPHAPFDLSYVTRTIDSFVSNCLLLYTLLNLLHWVIFFFLIVIWVFFDTVWHTWGKFSLAATVEFPFADIAWFGFFCFCFSLYHYGFPLSLLFSFVFSFYFYLPTSYCLCSLICPFVPVFISWHKSYCCHGDPFSHR